MIFKKNLEFYSFFVLVIFIFNFFVFPSVSEAKSSLNFSQSIIPVKFVYLDNKGNIENIWSNVKKNDHLYVVKFFSENDKNEVPVNDNVMSKFRNKLTMVENNNIQTLRVDFFKNGNVLEEVHTYV